MEQAERLREALKAAHEQGITRRQIAIAALGPGATKDRIKNMLSQMTKWTKADHGPNDASARDLGRAFSEVGLPQYDANYFMKPRAEPTWADRMRAIAEQASPTREEYQRGMAELRAEVRQAREEEEQRHREVLDQLREIREAI